MRSFPISSCLIGIFALAVFIGSLHAYGGVGSYGAGFMPTALGALLFVFTLVDATIVLTDNPLNINVTFVQEKCGPSWG